MAYDLEGGVGGDGVHAPAWTVQGTGGYVAQDPAGAAAEVGTAPLDVGWQHQHSHQQPENGAGGGYHIELRM